jgi:polyhydroxyalkanoate synthase subunit PhaC
MQTIDAIERGDLAVASNNAFDLGKIQEALQESSARWMHLMTAQASPDAANDLIKQWAHVMSQAGAPSGSPAGEPGLSAQDKRFSSEAWQAQPAYRMLAEAYLATSKQVMENLQRAPLNDKDLKRAQFFMKQYLDALAPSNFLATNPEAIKLAMETQGQSLKEGLENLQQDVAKGHVSITDESAFEVGSNIAVSPGAVVFENDIFQLLQYAPTTPEVFLRPILFVPPCINKFYILDLTPDNSLIRYLVGQGHTVFVMSWRNVGPSLGQLTWDDYIANGVVKAIDTVRVITNVDRINTLGFCVGGTLLACALAMLRRMGHDVVESTTFLTTFVDFTDVGDIDAYIDENFIARREQEVGSGGIVNGADLAFAFSSLRANDLVWSYVVSNYLKGKKPPAFDLLYWNADSTNLPGPWYCWYVRNTYVENNLVKPDRVKVCDVPIDMSYVDMPAFVFAAREDHIVPWRSAYASASLFSGDTEFTLGASGHIAGVINPASKNKRSFWSGRSTGVLDLSADQWLSQAHEQPGSWWTRWAEWLAQFGGRQIPARTTLGGAGFKPIEPAPGRYVREKTA